MDGIIALLFGIGFFISMNTVLYEDGSFFVVWGIVGAVLLVLKYLQVQRNAEMETINTLHAKAELCHDAHAYARTLASVKPYLDDFSFNDEVVAFSDHIKAVCAPDDVGFNDMAGYRFHDVTAPKQKLTAIKKIEGFIDSFLAEWDEKNPYEITNKAEQVYRFMLVMDDQLHFHFLYHGHNLAHLGNVTKDNATIVERSPLAGFLSIKDRYKHQYVIGKTGSGKTVLLRHQITQDINNGHGVVLITPERGLIDDVLSYVPEERADDVVFFNPADATPPIVGFNPFHTPPDQQLTQKAGELETIFLRALGDMGVKMRPLLSNAIYALIEGGLTLSDFPKLIDPYDNSHRNKLLARGVLDERTQDFFEKYDKSTYYKGAYEPIINRLDALLRPPLVDVLTTSALDFSYLLNKKKSIILCNLSSLRGMQAEIVGQLLLATFQQTFFQRDAMEQKYLKPYFFYMDEFQTYATANENSLKDFLTRARKYKVGICMAHQTIKDIPPTLSASIFGNCGTLVGMLMSAEDSRKFSKEAQLKNYDDIEDDKGTRSHIQLQNFEPGMCAITTPKSKKAFIARVPEHPIFDRREDIDALIAQSKQIYGVTPKAKPKSAPEAPTKEKQADSPTPRSQPQDDDDFDYIIS